jgi:hypothetical protein
VVYCLAFSGAHCSTRELVPAAHGSRTAAVVAIAIAGSALPNSLLLNGQPANFGVLWVSLSVGLIVLSTTLICVCLLRMRSTKRSVLSPELYKAYISIAAVLIGSAAQGSTRRRSGQRGAGAGGGGLGTTFSNAHLRNIAYERCTCASSTVASRSFFTTSLHAPMTHACCRTSSVGAIWGLDAESTPRVRINAQMGGQKYATSRKNAPAKLVSTKKRLGTYRTWSVEYV